MRLSLWPQSLFGRLIAASIVALLLAQVVSLVLIARERERFILQGSVREWSRRIAEVSSMLQAMGWAGRRPEGAAGGLGLPDRGRGLPDRGPGLPDRAPGLPDRAPGGADPGPGSQAPGPQGPGPQGPGRDHEGHGPRLIRSGAPEDS